MAWLRRTATLLLVASIALPGAAPAGTRVKFFPDGHWGSYFVKTWYSAMLEAAGEPPLTPRAADAPETYRFLYERSFDSSFCIRLTVLPTGAAKGVATVIDRVYDPQSAAVSFRYLKKQQWFFTVPADEVARLRGALSGWFWAAPADDGVLGLDGSSWILEGARGSKWHAISRWSPIHYHEGRPDAAQVEAVGRMMLKLAGAAPEPFY